MKKKNKSSYPRAKIRRLAKARRKEYKNYKSYGYRLNKGLKEVLNILEYINTVYTREKDRREVIKRTFKYRGKLQGTLPENISKLRKALDRLDPVERRVRIAELQGAAKAVVKKEIEQSVTEQRASYNRFRKSQAGRIRTDRQFCDYDENLLDSILEGRFHGTYLTRFTDRLWKCVLLRGRERGMTKEEINKAREKVEVTIYHNLARKRFLESKPESLSEDFIGGLSYDPFKKGGITTGDITSRKLKKIK